MELDSPAKMLPRLLLPYGQQWAERSGHLLLSRLLADEALRDLLERYGDEIVKSMIGARAVPSEATVPEPGPMDQDKHQTEPPDPASEHRQPQSVQDIEVLLEVFRVRARPLAEALGRCRTCLVGLPGCPSCFGTGRVDAPPDLTLLRTEVVDPLVESGVPLVLEPTEDIQPSTPTTP